MKIFKIAIVCSFMLTMISATAFSAGLTTNGTAGAPLNVATPGVSADTGTFDFTPSPSTLVSVFTAENEFSLATTSSKTTTENGVVYGILSSESAIFQLAQAEDGTNVTLAAANALPGDFQDKAGNEPGGS